MDWRETGILLNTRKHGETSLILDVFTPTHGRHAGVVRGGTSRKKAPHLQPGAQLDLHWRARLEDHLGAFTFEPQRSRMAAALGDRLSLAGLNAVTGLLCFCLPEREAYPALYRLTQALLDLLGNTDLWPLAYLHWELTLLEELGFALDLNTCAVTGATEGLIYVSPKTGRAVTAQGAGEWAERLLPLPPVMRGKEPSDLPHVLQALGTTGYFLEHFVAPNCGNRPLPAARGALLSRLEVMARPNSPE
ncbi:MAG: DNA repair protein RecO [Pelagimonas sp.]|jgi:DNA repair protein RecO (recombination protein O)|nr:DNA repair protein RecO [Pelagimonas sp.]